MKTYKGRTLYQIGEYKTNIVDTASEPYTLFYHMDGSTIKDGLVELVAYDREARPLTFHTVISVTSEPVVIDGVEHTKITTIVDAGHNGAPSRFDKKTYDAAYDKENTTQIRMKLNNKTDADILAKLASVPSKQGYIKQLIRDDLRAELNSPYMDEADELIAEGLYPAAVQLMDDDLREEINSEMAPCSDREFLAEYLRRHEAKLGKPFRVN